MLKKITNPLLDCHSERSLMEEKEAIKRLLKFNSAIRNSEEKKKALKSWARQVEDKLYNIRAEKDST